MHRLKKRANHVGPEMHQEVERHVVDGNNNRSLVQQAKMEFVIAKRLLASLPIVPTNERIYSLAEDMQSGLFDDLGNIYEAEQNWDAWCQRTTDVLKAKGILLASVKSRLKKLAKKKKFYDKYDILQFNVNGKKAECQNDPGAPVELSNGDEFLCPDCGSSVSFDIIDGDDVVLECCDCGNQVRTKLKGAK